MATSRPRAGQHHVGHAANNKQAQLGNAYQELGKELGSEKLKVVGGYTIGRVIGEGTYGSVHMATHRLTGTRCAIKKIPKSVTPHLTREIHHHRRLHHAHILHLHEILATETHVWLVSELCSGGELFDYLVERGRILEGEARRLFGELTVAVGWMHRQGVVHRDLKLENVLLDGELRIKLGDLGFAREWQRGRLMETFCGTTGYASPEMLAGRKYLGEETDIWSLGIILYILLSGGLPFDDDDELVMKSKILKGEYEEPEWLSTDARSLIRGMLQQDPAQRFTIEAILTHTWFKLTIVDKLSDILGDAQSLPPTPGPSTPLMADKESFFSEPFQHSNSGPSSSRFLIPHSALPSPLSTILPRVTVSSQADSEPSETSFEFLDSEFGKQDSGSTTPTTAEDDEIEPIKRSHSGEFTRTEKVLELLHQNGSQSTIRRSGSESPGSIAGSVVKNRVAVKGSLAGQTEVDEEAVTDEEVNSRDQSASLPIAEGHSLPLHLAQHARTPSRTKQRSVSSTMSLERRHSYNASSQWQTHPPEDYLARLDEDRNALFSTPSEKLLLSQLSVLGIDVGQLVHSVNSAACDASAATWWILRNKQLERGETDEAIEARNAAEARRHDRASTDSRDRRRKARAAAKPSVNSPTDVLGPNVTFNEETTAIPAARSIAVPTFESPTPGRLLNASPEVILEAMVPRSQTETSPSKSAPAIRSTIDADDNSRLPQTPPREFRGTEQLASPTDASPNRFGKSRSPSVSSMLQRATSAFVGVSKKSEDTESPKKKPETRSISPKKSVKPAHPSLTKSESESTLLTVPRSSPSSSISSLRLVPSDPQPESRLFKEIGTISASSQISHSIDSLASSSSNLASSGKVRASKRDSLWSTFRHLFIEDKKRRKGELPGSPLVPGELKVAPAVVLSRGIAARTPHVNRVIQPITANAARRLSVELHSHVPSRRSSSIHSRRSSITSMHGPSDVHEVRPAFPRQHSYQSHGSETPNSDREHQDYPSRPSSAHSNRRGSSRRSSQTMRSPSMQSDVSGRFAQNSPLHAYHRNPAAGSDSKRVKHYRTVRAAQVLRSGSRTSSIHSNTSSRASSVDRSRGDIHESDYDTGRDDTTVRAKRRKSSVASIAQQIHRARSPLAHPGQPHTHHKQKRKAPLRDVFKRKNDEWVSDDDESPTAFAGGLGQGNTHMPAKNRDKWAGAAAHPNVLVKHRGRSHRQAHGRHRRGSSDEEKDKKGTVVHEVPILGGGRRAGLPMLDNRGRPPPVEEEEEEE